MAWSLLSSPGEEDSVFIKCPLEQLNHALALYPKDPSSLSIGYRGDSADFVRRSSTRTVFCQTLCPRAMWVDWESEERSERYAHRALFEQHSPLQKTKRTWFALIVFVAVRTVAFSDLARCGNEAYVFDGRMPWPSPETNTSPASHGQYMAIMTIT